MKRAPEKEEPTDGTWMGLRETLFETRCFLLPGSWRNRRNNLETLWVNQQERDLSEKIQHMYVRQPTVAWVKLSTWQTRHIRQILINRLHTNVTFEESKTQTSTPTEPTRGHFPRSAYIHQWHVTVLRLGSKQNHCPFLASPEFRMQKPPKLVAFRSTYGGFLK